MAHPIHVHQVGAESLPPERGEGLPVSPACGIEQALGGADLPAGEAHGSDAGAQPRGLAAEGLELFARAVAEAPRASVGHAQLVLAIGPHHHKVCRCGWVSVAHVSAWSAEREGCPLHAAELERALRAQRSGLVIIAALRELAFRGGC